MVRMRTALLVLLVAASVPAGAFESTMGVVTARRVRLREGPSTTAAVVRELAAGTVGWIVEATEERERIDATREFSYRWYRIELRDGEGGWIYGQYFYPLEVSWGAPTTIRGLRTWFSVFREDAFLDDLPSQSRYALPCFVRDGEWTASFIDIDPRVYALLPSFQETSGRSFELPGTTFLLVSNDGIHEEAESVVVGRANGAEVVRLAISFSMQTGGGRYTLLLRPPTGPELPFSALDVEGAEIRSGL